MKNKIAIINYSPYHTASTLLVNILVGLIPKLTTTNIKGIWKGGWPHLNPDCNVVVVKAHPDSRGDIDKIMHIYGDKFDKMYFVCSERQSINAVIPNKFKGYDNVIVFQFEELLESESNPVLDIVSTVHNRLREYISEEDVDLDIELGVKRMNDMNKRYSEIKDKPFSFIDRKYEIHGSHRNRKNHQ